VVLYDQTTFVPNRLEQYGKKKENASNIYKVSYCHVDHLQQAPEEVHGAAQSNKSIS